MNIDKESINFVYVFVGGGGGWMLGGGGGKVRMCVSGGGGGGHNIIKMEQTKQNVNCEHEKHETLHKNIRGE